MTPSDRDTIVAIATGPGEGAIGIVRLSGSRAIEIADTCFCGKTPLRSASHASMLFGHFVFRDQPLDEVLVSTFKAPRSFTGEDSVEFNCHGGPFLLRRVLEALISVGARHAQAGEFTKRAFLNGKIDLSQAEAVADLISARSDFGLHAAFFQLRGGLRQRFEMLADVLRNAAMLLEAGLDFSEDVDIDPDSVLSPLSVAQSQIQALLESYTHGKLIREGAFITIAGRPNVGKSSLLNTLLAEDRAIVTDIPGTTRDPIQEHIDLNGIAATLVDTAGIRDTDDPVEREGTRRARLFMDRSLLVLYLVDGSAAPDPADLSALSSRPSFFLILNKSDLGIHSDWSRTELLHPTLRVSALTGSGISDLRDALRHRLIGQTEPNMEILTRERHATSLSSAQHHLTQAIALLESHQPPELAAMDIRLAFDALSDILGQTTPDDILDRIFHTFCIGK